MNTRSPTSSKNVTISSMEASVATGGYGTTANLITASTKNKAPVSGASQSRPDIVDSW